MRGCDVIAAGAISPLGVGPRAFEPGQPGEPAPTCVKQDAELAASHSSKPFAARAPDVRLAPGRDRAASLLEQAALALVVDLDDEVPDWRALRVGVCVGTSGGGMPSFVELVDALDAGRPISAELARAAPYFGPLAVLEPIFPKSSQSWVQVLAACASSTYALGLGMRWLELGVVDLCIAGGYDALSVFIASGFECLGATCREPTPFRARREGLALGEGAALLALMPSARRASAPLGRIFGFGAASDAVHITAPDRGGAGLARAARAALADAATSPDDVGLVSAHGTGTSYNDAAESHAIAAVLGASAGRAVVQPFKGVVGHTLGAAGALETLAACVALERGLAPAAHGSGEADPALTARLLDLAETRGDTRALKLSSAFGGANAALVLGSSRDEPSERPVRTARPVRVLAVGSPLEAVPAASELSGKVGTDAMKLARMDPVSLLAVGACVRVAERVVAPGRTGVVIGTSAATLEIDAEFERKRRTRGPEPRRFPATSPNLAPGECSIALGLHGPSLAVGADGAASLEALLVAHDLVASGDAEALLVVAVDHVSGNVERAWAAAGWPPPAPGAVAALLGCDADGTALSREAIVRALASARSAHGALSGAPGWPSLLELLQGIAK